MKLKQLFTFQNVLDPETTPPVEIPESSSTVGNTQVLIFGIVFGVSVPLVTIIIGCCIRYKIKRKKKDSESLENIHRYVILAALNCMN